MENGTQPLHHKVILITGATSGFGEAAARKLYSLGADVILHGRDPRRTVAAIERIQKAVPEKTRGRLDVLVADFAVLNQVYEMAEAFKRRYHRLDVLVNNAGAYFPQRQVSQDGMEMTFAVNHLAHHFLTRQLMEVLKASAPARVITVSSEAHHTARLDLSDYNLEKSYQSATAYANAKLCNVLFAYELARLLRRTVNMAVTSNCMHPGNTAMRIGRNHNWLSRTTMKLKLNPRKLSPEEGAETIVFLASSPEAAGVSGKYWINKEVTPTSVPSYDHDVAAQLWGLSETFIQRLVPAVQALNLL